MIEHRYGWHRLRGGFELYAAICRVLPEAHGAGWAIEPRGRYFAIRGPARRPAITELILRSGRVRLAALASVPLVAAEWLYSRIVVVRLTAPCPTDPAVFRARVLEHVTTRALALGARHVALCEPNGVRVHGRLIRGFSVRCWTPDPHASIHVQEIGIGGKRSMGCGVFSPSAVADGTIEDRPRVGTAHRRAVWR